MDISRFVKPDGTLERYLTDGRRLHFVDMGDEPMCHECTQMYLDEYGLADPVMSPGGAAILRGGDPLTCCNCHETIEPDTFVTPTLPLPFAA